MRSSAHANPGMGAFYLDVNRNKRSIVLDLKQEAARRRCSALAEGADVLVYNVRPQASAAARASPTRRSRGQPRHRLRRHLRLPGRRPLRRQAGLRRHHPGRLRPRAAPDPIVGEPRYVPTIVADKISSMARVAAVIAALFYRERTGKGQAVEVPMFESIAPRSWCEHLYGETFEPPIDDRRLQADPHPGPPPVQDEGRLPARSCRTTTSTGATSSPSPGAGPARRPALHDPGDAPRAHRGPLRRAAEDALTRTNAEWLAELDRRISRDERQLARATCCAIRTWRRSASGRRSSTRARARCACPGIPPTYGRRRRALIRRLPPRLGEHSVEVLREAGLGARRDRALLASGATRTAR